MNGEGNSSELERLRQKVREMEAQVERTQRVERRLLAMVEKAAEMVTLRDAQGGLIYASPSTETITGFSPEEIASVRFGDLIHPDDREKATGAFAALGPGQTKHGLRMRVKDKQGVWHHLEGSISNFLDDPAVGAIVANFRDVSQRLQLEEQLAQASKMESIGHLAAGIAHDFNNLITVISGYSEMALQELPAGQGLRQLIEPVLESSQRAAALTRQLLAFSRKQVLQPKILDLNQTVESMGGLLKRVLGEDIQISVLPSPGLHPVSIDPGQLEQIILNLAVNARDAMPQGGKLTLQTSNTDLDEGYVSSHGMGQTGPHVTLAISDTGGGMDAATKARIFEPFFTTKEVGKGTGLGLSTVYGIVKQSGGNIWVYSELGVGTTFKVYLPKAETTAPAAPEPAPRKGQVGHECILLVEDETALRQLFKKILTGQGYQVLDSGDPEEALKLCGSHAGEIHLLLTDMVMPRMGGRQLAEKAQALRPALRVAFMSGYTDDAIISQGQLTAGSAFIEKPVGKEELLKRVREFLA